ncbi:MAG TPA: 4-hydroxy-tetrahydrodipicolinate synthase [Deltaproteobacteria bacterium]|nr:4-hydroxy-tetrahydrodipicolinate synthase [Deltaproteobacteria bacterium]
MRLTGSFTALVTPFKDGGVDEEALRRLVDFQIENGTSGLVPCGTTGESATLSHDEHDRVIDIVIEAAGGRVPVIAGTGSNSTAETVRLTRHAAEAGADAALLITPYYNKPTQRGLYEHYRSVAGEVSIPLILYNVPGRTGVNMTAETVARLSEIDNIIGIKEATADMAQVSDVIEYSREGFIVLSGDDATTLSLLAVGGHGAVSVTSNVAPREMADMFRAFFEGDMEGARRIHYRLQPLNRAMFMETNPIPVKTALSLMGMVEEEFRLPLTAMTGRARERLAAALRDFGIGPKE